MRVRVGVALCVHRAQYIAQILLSFRALSILILLDLHLIWDFDRRSYMESLHEALEATVRQHGGSGSRLNGAVSSHTLPNTVPLSTLRAIYSKFGESGTPLFVGTREYKLVVSASSGTSKRKRPRHDDGEGAHSQTSGQDTFVNLCKIKGTPSELAQIRSVVNALKEIKGTFEEPALQSLTVERRKMDTNHAGPGTIVVAARMYAAVAVSLHALKRALASGWNNGAITIENSFDSMGVAFPEKSEEGKVAEEAGNTSWVAVFALDRLDAPSDHAGSPNASKPLTS